MPTSRPTTPPDLEAELHTISSYDLARLDFQRFTNDLQKRWYTETETAPAQPHEELDDAAVEIASD